MSRSYRKTKIFGITTCASEKQDKQLANRAFRRIAKAAVKADSDPPVSRNEVSDTWDFGKDGKQYWAKATKKDMSK